MPGCVCVCSPNVLFSISFWNCLLDREILLRIFFFFFLYFLRPMNVYDDVLEPTVVSHSLTGHFTTDEYEELLIARTNFLSVFKYDSKHGSLILTNEFKLNARINDFCLISIGNNSTLDCLAIYTGRAKVSVVRYDPIDDSLETLSLHYYEDSFADLSFVDLDRLSKLRYDPASKSLLLFNGDNIAILPFISEEEDEEDDDEMRSLSIDVNERNKVKKGSKYQRISYPSLVFNCKELHPEIQNVVDIQFLRNFTKPTVVVLYQPKLTWVGSLKLNRYPTCLMIVSLDLSLSLESSSFDSIVIAQLRDLPWDWFEIVSLSNGCVVLGNNEIGFIDNMGGLQSVILLNSFSEREIGKTRVIDNTKSQIILNQGSIRHLCERPNENNRLNGSAKNDLLLLMDEQSNLFYVQVVLEGRLLTIFDIVKLPIVNNVFANSLCPTTISRLPFQQGSNSNSLDLFIGFQSGDSLVVRLNNIDRSVETRGSHVATLQDRMVDGGNDDLDEDEIDLYGDDSLYGEPSSGPQSGQSGEIVETVEPFDIEVITSLMNNGPLTSITLGKASSVDNFVKGLPNPNRDELSIVGTVGNGDGSHLTVIQPSVQPEVELALKFISVTQIWNLKFKNRDKYLVTTDSTKSKSDVYDIEKNFSLFKAGRFRSDATTVDIALFGSGKRIVQATTNHLYLYDTEFRRLTTIKFDYEIVHVSILDPYILVTVSRGDIKIYELDSKHKKKLFKVNLPEVLKEMVITSGVILRSDMCNDFLPNLKDPGEEQLLFTFVTADNQVIFFTKNHHDRIFQLNGVDDLRDTLYISTYQLPDEVVPDPSIKQVMINKLGHKYKQEYLTILTFGGEVYQYKKSRATHSRFHKHPTRNNLRITGAPENAYPKGVSSIERIMHYIPDYRGYSVIFITGNVPYIIIKEDDAVPRIFRLTNIPLVSMAPWGKRSVMCVDDIKNARVYTLDCAKVYYGNRQPLKRVDINNTLQKFMTLTNITYHEKSQMYVVAYTKEIEYVPKSEDGEIIVGYDANLPHSKGFQSGLLLINPKTWNVIDQIDLDPNSLVNDVRSMIIQLDSRTKRKKEYIIAGIAYVGTEDLPATGSFYIFDITGIVPDPSTPDADHKFEKIFEEDTRGAVTVVCELSGRFAVNQNQKIMVRDIQEDNSVVPVAFLDTPIYVSDAKSFGNFFLVGDSMQGLQFIGFDAEPYRMIPLGKSVAKFEVLSLEFLPNGGELYFVSSDRNDIVHVFKYAPDEPNSLSGQRLVYCSSFYIFSTNSSMKLVAKNEEYQTSNGDSIPSFQALGTQVDGSLFKIMPVPEDTYRRFYVIQQQLIEKEPQLAGINPSLERLSSKLHKTSYSTRPMLDFNVIRRFTSLPISRRISLAQNAGRRAHFELWRDVINLELSLNSLCK